MRVLIVRHAIAADRGDPGFGRDEERALTPKGARRMRQAAAGIARVVPRPEALHTSPLVRAVETARILAEAWGGSPGPETAAVLAPGHSPAEVARWLKGLGAEALALVGHEPGCSELLSYLLVGSAALGVDFKKGGAALVEVGLEQGRPRGALLWLATPRLLRFAGG
jgi:phosphohistidine phosphatase